MQKIRPISQNFNEILTFENFETMHTNKTFPIHLLISIIGTVTEHLLVWEGDDSTLPEWTSGVDVDEEEESGQMSCNTRKDRFIHFSCILLLIGVYF